MSNPLPDQTERRLWIAAERVRPRDVVLETVGPLEVTHSALAEDGTWMLRFAHGVRYHNPAAPVAIVESFSDRLAPDDERAS